MKKIKIKSEEYCVKNNKFIEGQFELSDKTIIHFSAEDYYFNQWGASKENLAYTIDRLEEIHRNTFANCLQ